MPKGNSDYPGPKLLDEESWIDGRGNKVVSLKGGNKILFNKADEVSGKLKFYNNGSGIISTSDGRSCVIHKEAFGLGDHDIYTQMRCEVKVCSFWSILTPGLITERWLVYCVVSIREFRSGAKLMLAGKRAADEEVMDQMIWTRRSQRMDWESDQRPWPLVVGARPGSWMDGYPTGVIQANLLASSGRGNPLYNDWVKVLSLIHI